MKRPLVVALCTVCGGRPVDNAAAGPPRMYEYVGMNLCIKLGCPRVQVCGFRCTKHNRSFDLDPTKPRALRYCAVCGVKANDLAIAGVDLHTYHLRDDDVEAFTNSLLEHATSPAPLASTPPKPTRPPRGLPVPEHHELRMTYRKPKRRKKLASRLKHPFHPVVDLSISDSED